MLLCWLREVYGPQEPGADVVSFPEPEEIRLHYPVQLLERVLSILDAVEFKWTITQILEQPEALLDEILYVKSLAEKMKKLGKG